MPRTLRVHVNRDEPRSVEPEASEISVDGPIDLIVENHGHPSHVHVHVDDALATATQIPETNWFLDAGEAKTIPIEVESIDAVDGRLEIATGYGSERSIVTVHVAAGSGGVEVDEKLGTIQPDTEPEPSENRLPLVGAAFGTVGLLATVAVFFLVDNLVAVAIALLVIAGAVGGSLYLLLSG